MRKRGGQRGLTLIEVLIVLVVLAVLVCGTMFGLVKSRKAEEERAWANDTPGAISGTITFKDQPAQGVQVFAVRFATPKPNSGRPQSFQPVSTGPDGRYTLENVPAGDVWISLLVPRGDRFGAFDQPRRDLHLHTIVRPEKMTVADIELPPINAAVAATFVGGGHPMRRTRQMRAQSIYPDGGWEMFETTADSKGGRSVVVPAGRTQLIIRVAYDGQTHWHYENVIALAGETIDVELVFAKDPSLQLLISGQAQGSMLVLISLYENRESLRGWERRAKTNSNVDLVRTAAVDLAVGEPFVFHSVPPGSYTLEVSQQRDNGAWLETEREGVVAVEIVEGEIAKVEVHLKTVADPVKKAVDSAEPE